LTVWLIGREAKKGKGQGTEVFQSPRKHTDIPKRAENLENFQKDILHKTIFRYGEFRLIGSPVNWSSSLFKANTGEQKIKNINRICLLIWGTMPFN
jgi:hypothetical protein